MLTHVEGTISGQLWIYVVTAFHRIVAFAAITGIATIARKI